MQMRSLAALAALSALAGCSAERTASAPARSDATARYAGVRYGAEMPEGVREVEGVALPAGIGSEPGFLQVETADGPMLWLTRVVERTPDGRRPTGHEVLDAVSIREMADGEQLALMNCWRGETYSRELAAVVRFRENEQWMRPARAAWRVDRSASKLESVPTGGVRRENEGWGV